MAQRIRELTNRRTATAKHWLRDDGKIEAEIYSRPIHYWAANNRWADINLTPEDDIAVPGYEAVIRRAPVPVRFARTSKQPWRVELPGGRWVSYRAQGGNPSRAEITGNVVTYPDAWLDTDLRYTATGHGLKEEIILKAAPAPGSFSFAVETQGLVLEPDGFGGYLLTDQGETIGRLPAPWAEDANGERGPVGMAYDGSAITLTVDPDWLATAVYPVVVDPSTTLQPDAAAGVDSYVLDASADSNYGTDQDIETGKAATGDIYRGLIQFDLSSITGPISVATFSLYCWTQDSIQSVAVHQITATWAEGTVTWNNQPAHNGVAEDTTLINATGQYFDWDIATLAEEWRDGSSANYGLKIIGVEGSLSTRERFYSSDYGTANQRPKLAITYTVQPPTIVAPASVDDANPTEYTDEITPEIEWSTIYTQTEYQVQLYDTDGNLIHDSGEQAGAGTTYSPVIADGLLYDTTYEVRVRTKDDNGDWSAYTSGHYLKCIYSAPANLVATADAAGAEIGLAWDAHSGENLAGYYIYRKLSTDASYSLLKSTVHTSITYDDEIAASGVTYDYKVSAVATDGYEGPQSTSDQEAVTFTIWIINDTEVKIPVEAVVQIATPRRASSRVKTDGTYEVQDLGVLPRRARFTLQYETYAEMAALLALFPADTSFSYRDPQGRTFRGKVIGDIAEQQWGGLASDDFYGTISFEAAEVSA